MKHLAHLPEVCQRKLPPLPHASGGSSTALRISRAHVRDCERSHAVRLPDQSLETASGLDRQGGGDSGLEERMQVTHGEELSCTAGPILVHDIANTLSVIPVSVVECR